MYIPQDQLAELKSHVAPGKVVIIYGPRRVGKTTLLKSISRRRRTTYLLRGKIFSFESISLASLSIS